MQYNKTVGVCSVILSETHLGTLYGSNGRPYLLTGSRCLTLVFPEVCRQWALMVPVLGPTLGNFSVVNLYGGSRSDHGGRTVLRYCNPKELHKYNVTNFFVQRPQSNGTNFGAEGVNDLYDGTCSTMEPVLRITITHS